MRLSRQVVLASSNHHKWAEYQGLVQELASESLQGVLSWELVPASEKVRNLERLSQVEKYETYFENALAKARFLNRACHYPVLADDSGLEIDALQGRPGVRSRRFSETKSQKDTPELTQDQANIKKVLEDMKGQSSRRACFVSCLVLLMEGLMLQAKGQLYGSIAEAPVGKSGFGYDAIFIPEGGTRTLAEYSLKDKNSISHRALAFKKLLAEIHRQGLVFAKP